MDFNEFCMNEKELTNLLRAFVLALDEVLDYEALEEATLKHYGPINEDQLRGFKAFIQALKRSELSEDELDKTLQELDVESFIAEMLQTETEPADEPEEE